MVSARLSNLNLNLNGLLVIRQIDNTSSGGVPGGKLVPGSQNRCKLGHTVIRHFSRGGQENQGGYFSP